MSQFIKLTDGRKLSYELYGDPQGIPCFFFHGFPGSKLQGKLADMEAKRNQVLIIAADRPGLGDSDFDSRRTLKSSVEDIAQLAVHLKIQKFHLIGVSGGAPYAMAMAHYFKDRTLSLGLICPLGPIGIKNHRRPLPLLYKTVFLLAQKHPGLLRIIYGSLTTRFRKNPDAFFDRLSKQLSIADQRALAAYGVRELLRSSFLQSSKQNPQYPVQDLIVYSSSWGFQLSELDVPTYIWQGNEDRILSPAGAKLIADEIPNCVYRNFDGMGHYSLAVGYIKEMMETMFAKKNTSALVTELEKI